MNSKLNTLIQDKIVQFENTSTTDADEERFLAKEMKKVTKEVEDMFQPDLEKGEPVTLLKEKYFTLFQEKSRLELSTAKLQRKTDQLLREQEILKTETKKANEMKSKLENLCRELQRENKRVKEESLRIAHEEQKKREEISGKFEKAIEDIRVKMDLDSEENKKRAEDNDMLKEKFKGFLEQYELREQHHTCVLKSKDLELQLLEAKINQHKETTEQEMAKTQSLGVQLTDSVKREAELREQLMMYVEKFKQVEETLGKSNEIFTTFRKEMEQMTKKTKKYEKENLTIKQKCDKMSRVILEMAEEKSKYQQEFEASNKKLGQLENLCRVLQNERNSLQKKAELLEASLESPVNDEHQQMIHTMKGLLQKKEEFLSLSHALAEEREMIKSQFNTHISTLTANTDPTENEVNQPSLEAYTTAQETLKNLCSMIEDISL